MPPLPKRKYARARQGERRQHLRLKLPAVVPCRQCKSLKPAHQVCPTCGTYAGRDVLRLGEKREEKKGR